MSAQKVTITFAPTCTLSKRARGRAESVVFAVAIWLRDEDLEFFIGDQNHGDVDGDGAFSIAMEGVSFDWPYRWSDTDAARKLGYRYGLSFQAVNGCILAAYPEK